MGRGRPDQVRAYAAELVGMMPDVLAANSGPALAALLRETRTIPIVFASILDPVGSGFVSSLAHPGGNATGFASLDPAITGKWLELLKEIAPKVTRVSAISDRDNPAAYAGFVRAMRDLAPSLGVEFKSDPVANLEDIERAIDSISSAPEYCKPKVGRFAREGCAPGLRHRTDRTPVVALGTEGIADGNRSEGTPDGDAYALSC